MATAVSSVENMTKHLTPAERSARLKAEASMFRATVKLTKPKMVSGNKAANKYWNDTVKRMKGISLLDDLDSDMLAQYCIMSARRDDLNAMAENAYQSGLFDVYTDYIKLLQAQERIILQYAGKLGLTAESRARLAKKAAEQRQTTDDPEAEMFD